MGKKFMPWMIIVALAATLWVPVNGYAATTREEINRQLTQVQQQRAQAVQQQRQLQNQLNQVNNQIRTAEQDLQSLIRQIDEAESRMTTLNAEIGVVTDDLHEAATQLDDASDRVDARDNLLRNRLRMMYMNGFVSYMDVLMSSTSFTDFLDRYQAVKQLIGQDKDILEANIRDRELIEEQKRRIETKLDEITLLYGEMEELKAELLVKEDQKSVQIASLQSDRVVMSEISKEQEEELMKLAAREAALRDQLYKFDLNSDKMAWPVPQSNRITSRFGVRVDPITGRAGAQHNGLDIGAPQGTTIIAAASGTVIMADYWGGYGNTVIIDHGSNVWTLYAHIRPNGIMVKKGDEVKKGDKIAEVGTTGNSTGPHLHFEVRVNEKAVNPEPYLPK